LTYASQTAHGIGRVALARRRGAGIASRLGVAIIAIP